jgi:hypothetical protein
MIICIGITISLLIFYVITNFSVTKYLQQQLKIISLLNEANDSYKRLMTELKILSRSQQYILFYFSCPFLNSLPPLTFPLLLYRRTWSCPPKSWRCFGISQEITVTTLPKTKSLSATSKELNPQTTTHANHKP